MQGKLMSAAPAKSAHVTCWKQILFGYNAQRHCFGCNAQRHCFGCNAQSSDIHSRLHCFREQLVLADDRAPQANSDYTVQ